ncbi:ABC transporter ATP-binding protein YtrE [Clostridium tepidiprofundi DSM 19306]|uniref:ABC transporter ATP-binding protein YtrE n=1 Tax=Clostridium tepidiprofundi DSM 19306 TaxID=1121338 RepID=A0A151B6N6_9CLOT|nr:ABC transporter ATP-binding protein [Clostridium tepidiprofundi]KYH35463.1 ABC transporter ATP-binding protein YtrE [Clostridium tepidiprofundi DSM 19306]
MKIKVENVSKKYNMAGRDFWALKNVSLDIDKGEIVTILGPSGSGKSTLLNAIGGIDKVDEGKIIIGDLEISSLKDDKLTKYRRDKVGFVFQFYNLIPNLTVWENVEVATNISENPLDIGKVLESVGMYDNKDKFPSELSGGEQQRVSIARAVAKNPDILLCDEPTGALDYVTSKELLKLIEKINSEYDATIIIVTHNIAISKMSDKIIKLRSGEITSICKNIDKISAEEVEW